MSYAVTPLRLDEHREALSRLWAENMSDGRIASAILARMRWIYEEGPEGPATTVLAVHVESGEIVGCGSYLPRLTSVDGRSLRAGVLCDFAVTRAHRIAGAALAIQRALVQAAHAAGLQLLYGYPNDKSLAVFRRIGYRVVGQTTSWVKALRSEYKLRPLLRSRSVAAACSVPVDAGLQLLDLVRSLRVRRARGEPVARPDGRADALWERARARWGVVGEKSSAYLDWRYLRFTTAEHRIFGVLPPADGRLAAYTAYSVEDDKAFLRELFAEDLDAAESLLHELGRRLRGERVDSISLSYVGGPAFGERLRKLGFHLRPRKRSLVVYPEGIPDAVRARVMDPASWFMLDGELDI